MALFILLMLDKKGKHTQVQNIPVNMNPNKPFPDNLFALVSLCASLKLTLVPWSQYEKKSVVEAKFREVEKESCNSNPSSPSIKHTLKNDTDLLTCKAEYFNQCGEYQKCFELTSE